MSSKMYKTRKYDISKLNCTEKYQKVDLPEKILLQKPTFTGNSLVKQHFDQENCFRKLFYISPTGKVFFNLQNSVTLVK